MSGIQTLKYKTDKGNIFYALVDEADGIGDIIGTEPPGDVTEDMTVRISKNRRQSGIQPRHVVLARKVGAVGLDGNDPGDGNKVVQSASIYKRQTVLSEEHFDLISIGQSFVVNGVSWKVKRKADEQIR